MEDSRKEALERAGVNLNEALERFMGNEELLVRFLKKFVNDSSYQSLVKAMGEKNAKDAFEAAHALKGVCGNLSIAKLFEHVCRLVELLRGGNMGEEADQCFAEVVAEYERVIDELKNL
ncbi:MAG: Hpt domain-containing protein [Clostridium sp.]|nr:Hpt domain-containing protein [Clostridium sp.]